jgi:hypothetical protein
MHCHLNLDGEDGIDVGRFKGGQEFLDFEQNSPLGRISKELRSI